MANDEILKPHSLVIPKEILLHPALNCTEKVLLSEIHLKSSRAGQRTPRGCFASNQYLSLVVGLSEGRVKNLMVEMEELEYIIVLWRARNARGVCVSPNLIPEKIDVSGNENVTDESRKRDLTSSTGNENVTRESLLRDLNINVYKKELRREKRESNRTHPKKSESFGLKTTQRGKNDSTEHRSFPWTTDLFDRTRRREHHTLIYLFGIKAFRRIVAEATDHLAWSAAVRYLAANGFFPSEHFLTTYREILDPTTAKYPDNVIDLLEREKEYQK